LDVKDEFHDVSWLRTLYFPPVLGMLIIVNKSAGGEEKSTQRASKVQPNEALTKKLHCLDYLTRNAAINLHKKNVAGLSGFTVQTMSHTEMLANGACQDHHVCLCVVNEVLLMFYESDQLRNLGGYTNGKKIIFKISSVLVLLEKKSAPSYLNYLFSAHVVNFNQLFF